MQFQSRRLAQAQAGPHTKKESYIYNLILSQLTWIFSWTVALMPGLIVSVPMPWHHEQLGVAWLYAVVYTFAIAGYPADYTANRERNPQKHRNPFRNVYTNTGEIPSPIVRLPGPPHQDYDSVSGGRGIQPVSEPRLVPWDRPDDILYVPYSNRCQKLTRFERC